jgi:hypothetical protein
MFVQVAHGATGVTARGGDARGDAASAGSVAGGVCATRGRSTLTQVQRVL